MYNGPRPRTARQEQWKLFRALGANGVVIPADSVPEEAEQLGGDQTAVPTWLTDSMAPPDTAGTR
jgi:hypothetical protein